MLSNSPRPHAPAWMIAIIILAALPVTGLPTLLSAASASGSAQADIVRTICYFYPFYVIVSAWLAYVCYPTRRYMTWILLVLMVLTHVAMWMLVTGDY